MSNYINISGPFGTGLKPKSFFSETKDLHRTKLMSSDSRVKAKYTKYIVKDEVTSSNPHLKELQIIAPWILMGALLLVSVFS
ncbi:MAG: hypothetical protein IPM42_13255 [Saprospiraceae bacterium]|nr:hypothetical protein [Saprospiraceae bacterium]